MIRALAITTISALYSFMVWNELYATQDRLKETERVIQFSHRLQSERINHLTARQADVELGWVRWQDEHPGKKGGKR